MDLTADLTVDIDVDIDEHWWRPAPGYPTDLTVHAIVAAQGARTPDAPACVTTGPPGSGDRILTYRELLGAASTLAARIEEALR